MTDEQNDIVEQLRDFSGEDSVENAELVKRAADEIERIRADNAEVLRRLAVKSGWDSDEWDAAQPAIDRMIDAAQPAIDRMIDEGFFR